MELERFLREQEVVTAEQGVDMWVEDVFVVPETACATPRAGGEILADLHAFLFVAREWQRFGALNVADPEDDGEDMGRMCRQLVREWVRVLRGQEARRAEANAWGHLLRDLETTGGGFREVLPLFAARAPALLDGGARRPGGGAKI